MVPNNFRYGSVCLIFLLSVLSCQLKRQSNDELLASIDLLRGDIALCGTGQFGDVRFSLSCGPETQESFNLALSLLHSFEYDEAEKAFVKVIDKDPGCVMAYWGVAMSNFHSLWIQSGTDYLEKGSKILQAAQPLPKTEKEKDYLDAIGAFYADWETIDRTTRSLRFEKKMEALYKKYQGDTEVAIFYALALTTVADPANKTYSNQKKSGAILEKLFQEQPNHPGIAHYIIHNYDYPELAEQALPTARRYAQIAPASAHAQHMPSHIFTRLGLWKEAIQSDLNSTAAALCYGKSIDSTAHWDEELHGMDYLLYAYLQRGDNQKAYALHDYLKTFKKVFPVNFKVAYAAAACPSRIALENKNWKEAVAVDMPSIEMDWKIFPWQLSIIHFTRALGSIRLGNIASAKTELSALNEAHQQLLADKNDYMANQVMIQIKAVQAWLKWAAGEQQLALEEMKEAVAMEYSTSKHPVTPGEVLPAGELLGDLFILLNKPAEALVAYETDLKIHPNRFNGIYGAAVAAKRSGNKTKATEYFKQLLKITEGTDSSRKELEEAQVFLARLKITDFGATQ